jgi:hypothetical protein
VIATQKGITSSALWLFAICAAAGGCTPPASTPVAPAKTVSYFDAHKEERVAKLVECRESGISASGDSPAIRECNAALNSRFSEQAKLEQQAAAAKFEVSRLKADASWRRLDPKAKVDPAKEAQDLAQAETNLKNIQAQLHELK